MSLKNILDVGLNKEILEKVGPQSIQIMLDACMLHKLGLVVCTPLWTNLLLLLSSVKVLDSLLIECPECSTMRQPQPTDFTEIKYYLHSLYIVERAQYMRLILITMEA